MTDGRDEDWRGWAESAAASTQGWLAGLARSDGPGRYRWCGSGLTESGRRLELGPSCLAAKVLVTVGAWDGLPAEDRGAWVRYLQTFQLDGPIGRVPAGMFRDPAMSGAGRKAGWRQPGRWWRQRWGPRDRSPAYRVAVAETKQAVATLAELGAGPRWPLGGLPKTVGALRRRLAREDWSRPWAAGGQTAALAALVTAEAEAEVDAEARAAGQAVLGETFDRLADPRTGAYFDGPTPPPHQLINGAMKVLTGLAWLGRPIHHPRRLVDLCLDTAVRDEGCDLVDVVYVLHRCVEQEPHRLGEVRDRAAALLARVRRHEHAGGGFSYQPGRAQTHYYGLEVSEGRDVADLHGSCLLLWAVALALDLRGQLPEGWRLIRP